MSDRDRERLLKLTFFGLIGFVAVWLYVWPMADRFLFGTIRERIAEIEDLEPKVQRTAAEKRKATIAERQTVLWKALSLPPDPIDAQRLYQKWLTDLVTELGFESPEVKPGQRIPHRRIYTTVVVDIDGVATYDTVVRFLFHAQRTSLMHRIAKLDLTATGTSPADPLNVRITAEGFSFAEATPRSRLVPRTELAGALDREATVVTVASTTGFPGQPGFEIRYGGESAKVTAIDGKRWTLDRGLHRSRVGPHAAGSAVELVRVADAWREVSLADYEGFIARNPFAKPRQYVPSVAPIRDRVVEYGAYVEFPIVATGHDESKGKPVFELVEGTENEMVLDAETGEFAWFPSKELETGEYNAKVRVTFPGVKTPLEREFTLTLRDVNKPPVVAKLEPAEVSQGELLSFVATATDPEGARIEYQLRDAPRGAKIDRRTGEFEWRVSDDYELGAIEFDVVAEDAGGASGLRTLTVTVLENSARNTYLVGVYDRDGRREAWLFDRSSETRTTLTEGTDAKIAGIDSFVLVIGRNFLLLQQDDETFRLDLGRSLTELEPQSGDGTP